MKVTFEAIKPAMVGDGMHLLTVSSKGRDGKKPPFAPFYIILPSVFMADIWALPKWAQAPVLEVLEGLLKAQAAQAKRTGRASLDLPMTAREFLSLATAKVEQGLIERLLCQALQALGQEEETAEEKAAAFAVKIWKAPSLPRLEKLLEVLDRSGLDDPELPLLMAWIESKIKELSADPDELGV